MELEKEYFSHDYWRMDPCIYRVTLGIMFQTATKQPWKREIDDVAAKDFAREAERMHKLQK